LSGSTAYQLSSSSRRAAHGEGIGIIRALLKQYASGENRFAGPGEFLLAAKADSGAIIGVCGLNRVSDTTARVRRLYVLPDERGQGVGSALLCEVFKRNSFSRLELRAMTEGAARFYERHGFRAMDGDGYTHDKMA
jgi:N-acetylglutamate synthase-like GNAT family acetyltransferase